MCRNYYSGGLHVAAVTLQDDRVEYVVQAVSQPGREATRLTKQIEREYGNIVKYHQLLLICNLCLNSHQ